MITTLPQAWLTNVWRLIIHCATMVLFTHNFKFDSLTSIIRTDRLSCSPVRTYQASISQVNDTESVKFMVTSCESAHGLIYRQCLHQADSFRCIFVAYNAKGIPYWVFFHSKFYAVVQLVVWVVLCVYVYSLYFTLVPVGGGRSDGNHRSG